MIIQPPDHSKGKVVRLAFGIRPKDIMAQFVVYGIDPFSLGVIFPSLLPVFLIDHINLSVLFIFSPPPPLFAGGTKKFRRFSNVCPAFSPKPFTQTPPPWGKSQEKAQFCLA